MGGDGGHGFWGVRAVLVGLRGYDVIGLGGGRVRRFGDGPR